MVYLTVVSSIAPTLSFTQDVPPSFDCRRASTQVEHTICENDHLAEMDQAASIAFNQIPAADRKYAKEEQIKALEGRNACGSDRICILDNQVQALQAFNGFGPKIPVPPWVGSYRLSLLSDRTRAMGSRLPASVGQCAKTKIVGIADRFGGEIKPPNGDDVDHGSSVDFANDGHQVSYSYEAPIASSAIGDDVVVCLVSLPKDCPKGDDRGKIYSTTNLRTKGSWVLPDAQHMCGGA